MANHHGSSLAIKLLIEHSKYLNCQQFFILSNGATKLSSLYLAKKFEGEKGDFIDALTITKVLH